MTGSTRWMTVMGAAASLVAAAAASPEPATPTRYEEAMAAARDCYTWRSSSVLNRPKIDFAAAQDRFRKAVALARNDAERAAALLDLADSRLRDIRETNYASIRADYEQVLALPEAGAREKARAALGVGEACVREGDYDRGREQFAKARALSDHPVIGIQVQYALAYSYLQQRRFEDARREFSLLLESDGLTEPLKWRARALLEGLDTVPRVRRNHPRLFFNAETWPAVKARALGPQKAAFEAMRTQVERLPDGNPVAKDWGDELMEAAFVYRVTGDPALLEKIRAYLRTSVDFYLGRTEERGRMYTLTGSAAALDWVWEDLAPREREALARDLIHYVHSHDVEDQIQLEGTRGMLIAGDYYVRGIPLFFGLAAFGEELDDVTYGRAFTALSRGFRQYRGFLDEAVEKGGDDGAIRTALGYYFAETLTGMWVYLYCWEAALGEPADPRHAYFLSPDYILRNALAFNRLGSQSYMVHFGYGKSFRPERGMRADLLYDHLNQWVHFFGRAHPDLAHVALYTRGRMDEAGAAGRGDFPIFPFLKDPVQGPPPALPTGLPIARHFGYAGQVLMSSGFGPSDVYVLFSCGDNQDYGQFDATHFTLYKQGYLALDSGTEALVQLMQNGPPGINYDPQTVAHNCVLIYMEGEEFPYKVVNSGGQCRSPRDARLLAFESHGRHYAYAATDATPVYHEAKCAQMVRQFLYFPPDHFVVFDRVVSTRPDYPKTWLLHTANEPLIEGREFRADQRDGRLFCRTVYPPDAVLEAVGGPGREFWAGGRNWPIPTNSPCLHAIGADRGDHVPESIGRWRVEVMPGAPRTNDWFLHLIQTSDRTVERMPDSRMMETEDSIRIGFDVGPRTIEATLNKAGAVGGHLRMMECDTVLIDRPLTQAIMPQAGLALEP